MQKLFGKRASRMAVLKGLVAAAVLLVACWGGAAQAQLAFSDISGSVTGNNENSFLGSQFTVTNPGGITVTGLGIWLPLATNAASSCYTGSGTVAVVCDEDHYVGLFASNGTTLLGSTTVDTGESWTAGDQDAVINNLTQSIYLAPGTYDVGAYYSQGDGFGGYSSCFGETCDLMVINAGLLSGSGVTFDTSIGQGSSGNGPGNNFALAGTGYNNPGYFGPDFTYQLGDQIVPEPASLTLFGSALVGLSVLRRRRRARKG